MLSYAYAYKCNICQCTLPVSGKTKRWKYVTSADTHVQRKTVTNDATTSSADRHQFVLEVNLVNHKLLILFIIGCVPKDKFQEVA